MKGIVHFSAPLFSSIQSIDKKRENKLFLEKKKKKIPVFGIEKTEKICYN
jgi:hypothetical protein